MIPIIAFSLLGRKGELGVECTQTRALLYYLCICMQLKVVEYSNIRMLSSEVWTPRTGGLVRRALRGISD